MNEQTSRTTSKKLFWRTIGFGEAEAREEELLKRIEEKGRMLFAIKVVKEYRACEEAHDIKQEEIVELREYVQGQRAKAAH